jgi:glucoamylase
MIEVDVRIEPKFEIPSGEPYTGGWCRPQTDGPALRAMALSKWGMLVKQQGGDTNVVWEAVSYDMAWVTENWRQNGCDLWEEVRSEDFYFNRMAYIYSLNIAADFADQIGQSGANYRSVAEEIKGETMGHWKDGFLYESTNRPYDGAVIHSIATFGEYLFPPESQEAASTISVITKTFCQEYPINQDELAAGLPGILIGRYPGDSYAGGNPWQLLTAVLGELFYLGGQASYKQVKSLGDSTLNYEENKAWMDLLNLSEGASASELAAAQVAAGDAVMQALWRHVQDAGGRIDEQIDKFNGAQVSAEGLTWSYANILHALHTREQVIKLKQQL